MKILFIKCGNEVKITKKVIKAVAKNLSSGKEVIALLFNQHSDKVKITKEVVKAVAKN